MSYRTGYKTDQDRNDPLVFFLHQVTDDLVVKVLNRLPLQGNIGRGKRRKRGEGRGGEGGGKSEGKRSREGGRGGGRREGRGEERGGKGKRKKRTSKGNISKLK